MGTSKVVVIGTCILAIGSACFAAAACGGSSSSPSDTDGGTNEGGGAETGAGDGGAVADAAKSVPITAPPGVGKSFCDKIIGDALRELDGCCTADDRMTTQFKLSYGFGTAFETQCETAMESSIGKGRVRYRPDALGTCAAALDAFYAPGKCTSLTEPVLGPSVVTCGDVFAGVGADGAACAGTYECEEGLTCVGYGDGADGTCKSPPPIGSPCGAAPGDGSTSITYTLSFGRHPPCAPGAACSSASHTCVAGGPGTRCSDRDDCDVSLDCVRGVCGTTKPADVGGACDAARDCVRGTFCAKSGQPEGQCTAKKTAGGTCSDAFSSECIGRCDVDGGAASGACASYCGSR